MLKLCLILILFSVFRFAHGQSTTKSNVAFVIDDTESMAKEINQVKDKVRVLFKAVTESKNSKIDNFILITFNDYEYLDKKKNNFINDTNRETIKVRANTRDTDEFLRKLSEIKVSGGGRCPELSMAGIKKAIEECKSNSYVYVFTDASAKDYTLAKEVANMAQTKSIQINFFLTGVCYGINNDQRFAYNTLANATSGEIFDLNKNDKSISQITKYVIECIQSPKTTIGNVPFNPGTTNININVDSDMKNLSISVNVDKNKKVDVDVNDPQGSKAKTTNIFNKPNSKVVGIADPMSGVYTATVNSTGKGIASIKASINIDFQYGFSAIKLPSITNTRTRPIKGENSYLHVKLEVTGNVDAYIKTVQINDINDKEIRNLSVTVINQQEKIYVTQQFMPPDTTFKVAITAVNKNDGKEIVRNAPTPVTPQEPPTEKLEYKQTTVIIEKGSKIDVKYNDQLVLVCKVKAYPKPTIVWEDEETGANLPSTTVKIEEPYDYISVLVINQVKNNNMYKCKATNDPKVGTVAESIKVETTRPNFWNVLESPKDTTINFGDIGKIYCKIDSWPPSVIKWYKDGKELTSDADFTISNDKTTLVVKNMRPELDGNYFCKASNDDNFNTLKFTISLSGIDPPVIYKSQGLSQVIKGSRIVIPCRILKGLPTSTITWEFKRHDATDFLTLSGTDQEVVIDPVELSNAGIYKCHVKNFVGEAFHETKLEVQYPPEIDKTNSNIIEKEGSKTKLSCRIIKGIPDPYITWEFKKKYTNDFFRIPYKEQDVFINPVELDSAGIYKCEAKNLAGNDVHEIKLTVEAPPKIDKNISNSVAKDRSKTSITCRIIKGIPDPVISWEFQKKDTNAFVSIPDIGQEIHKDSVDLDDAGIYRCSAKNSLGNDVHEIKLSVQSPPEIDTRNNAIIANRGSEVIIPCRIIKGIPEPQITWEFKEKDTTDFVSIPDKGQEIHRDPVDIVNAGVYKCHAKNMIGEQFHEVKLTVQYPPEIDKSRHRSIIAKQGTKTFILCRIIKGIPEPEISWEFKRKDTSDFLSISEMGEEIRIDQADVQNAGIYKCLAKNSVGQDFHETELIVQYPPVISKSKLNQTAKIGSSVNLSCRVVQGNPLPLITWKFKRKLANEYVNLPETNQEITINPVDRDSVGYYKCEAKNIMGEDFHEIKLTVEYSPTVDVEQFEEVKIGDTVILSCDVTGEPKPVVTWLKDNVVITSDNKYRIFKNNGLRFVADFTDQGNFTCEASNNYGSDAKNTTVDVYVPVKIDPPNDNPRNPDVGSDIELLCEASGHPTPSVTWKFSSDPSVIPGHVLSTDKILTIKRIQSKNSGIYTCTADNGYTNTFITYEVNVKVPVEIERPDQTEFNIVENDLILKIPCKAKGFPKPAVTWSFNFQRLYMKNSYYDMDQDNTLIIKNPDKSSEGKYTCIASSADKRSIATQSFIVNVAQYPDPSGPIDTILVEENTSPEIKCKVPHTATDTLRWYKNGNQIPIKPTNSEFKLFNAAEKDAGIYSCHVSTLMGSESAHVNIKVGTKPTFRNRRSNAVIVVPYVKRRKANLDCEVIGKPTPTITWYQDNIKLSETATQYVFEMANSDIGVKRCEATNAFGTISRSYQITITGCTINSMTVDPFKYHPLIVNVKRKLNEYENQNGVMTVPEKDIVEIVCPNNVNRFYCSNNDFIDLYSSVHYTYENLKCNQECKVNLVRMSLGNTPCSNEIRSRLIQVGFSIDSSFASVYDVCLDMDTKRQIFAMHELNHYASDFEMISKVTYDSQYIYYPYDHVYDCNQQGNIYGNGCCYLGRQLVSQRDVPPGLQKTTYFNINVVPLWNYCGNVHNWDEVEKRIRDLAKSVKYKLIVFSGGFQYETKSFGDVYGINKYNIEVPRYIWKVVRINERSQALAIITINIPNLTETEAEKLVFCKDKCDLTDWMRNSDWHMVDKGYTFCCNAAMFADKFSKKFKGLFKGNILYSKNII